MHDIEVPALHYEQKCHKLNWEHPKLSSYKNFSPLLKSCRSTVEWFRKSWPLKICRNCDTGEEHFNPCMHEADREPMIVERGRGHFCPSPGARCYSNQWCGCCSCCNAYRDASLIHSRFCTAAASCKGCISQNNLILRRQCIPVIHKNIAVFGRRQL